MSRPCGALANHNLQTQGVHFVFFCCHRTRGSIICDWLFRTTPHKETACWLSLKGSGSDNVRSLYTSLPLTKINMSRVIRLSNVSPIMLALEG